jgi:biopolymer transport protein TolR
MAMPSRTSGGNSLYQPMPDINVTPLVDVMLVLLIVFMITAPMLSAGLKVDLPQAKTAQTLDPKQPVVITVAKDGKLTIGGDTVAREDIASAVRKLLAGENRHVHVRGDRDVAYGEVVALMDHLAAHGIVRIALLATGQGGKTNPAPEPRAPRDLQSQ